MIDKVSVIILQEPDGPAGLETLWIIVGEDQPHLDSVPVAYEHPDAVQILGPSTQAVVQLAADRLVEVFKRMGLSVIQASFPGD